MKTSANKTCRAFFSESQVSDGFRLYSQAYFGIILIIVLPSVLTWTLRRNSLHLQKRSLTLALLCLFGYSMQVITSVVPRAFGRLPCQVQFLTYCLCMPYILIPSALRLSLWRNKVVLNYNIAKDLAFCSGCGINTLDKTYDWKRFYASRKYALVLAAGVLVPYTTSVAGFAFSEACKVCDTRGHPVHAFFVVLVCAALFFFAWELRYTQHVPDVVGVRKEILQGALVSAVVGLPPYVLFLLDVGGFEEAEIREFSWAAICDVAYLLFMIFTFSLQSYIAGRTTRDNSTNSMAELHKMLEKDFGCRYFMMYLATELSLENVLFYKEVEAWKNDKAATPGSVERLDAWARSIYHTYFGRSHFQVNVSWKIASEVANYFAEDSAEIPIEVFDSAQSEVFLLMAGSSYLNFKSSVFHKLYNGEISSNDVVWLETSGLSLYFQELYAEKLAYSGRKLSGVIPTKKNGWVSPATLI